MSIQKELEDLIKNEVLIEIEDYIDELFEIIASKKEDENTALTNYANQTNMYQTGEALGKAQGQEISDMADKLTASGVTGSEFDKQLNERVNQMYSENKARVSNNPTDALKFIKENVVVPQGIDPSKIIQINDNLENKFIRMQERKDDFEYIKLKDQEDAAFRKQELGMQQQQLNASLQEIKDREKEKQEERESIINTFSASSGVNDNLINSNKKTVTTDKVILDETKKEVFNKDFESIINNDKILNENNKVILNEGTKVLTPEQKTDEALKKSWEEKYSVNKSGISNIGSSIANAIDTTVDKKIGDARNKLISLERTGPTFLSSEAKKLEYETKHKELLKELDDARKNYQENKKPDTSVAPSFE